MPCAAARSASATGTGAPPSPTRRIRRACSGVKSGWSRMLARNTDAPVPAPTSASSMIWSTRAGSQRSIRWMSCARVHRREHRAEHAGRVRDRRAHEVGRTGRDPRAACARARRAACGDCASRPWGRSSCPTCTRARTRRRGSAGAIAAAGVGRVDDVPRDAPTRASGGSSAATRPRRAARDRAARRARRRRRCRGSRRGRSGRRRCTRRARLWPRMKRTSFGP